MPDCVGRTCLRKWICVVAMSAAPWLSPGCAIAQNYPERPVRFVLPSAVGGATDTLGRLIAQKLTVALGKSVVADNRAGGGGNIGYEIVAKSAPDGYTLMLGATPMAINVTLFAGKMNYDVETHLMPVTLVGKLPLVLGVHPSVPAKTVKEFVALAKAYPGKLSYGSAGLGTLQHVWGAILVKQLGLDMLHVPFKGAAPAHQEMLGGRVDIMFDNLSASKGYVQSAKMKGLAVSSVARSAALPQVPTVNETGVTRFEGESWFGIFVPAATPAPILARLREALLSVTRDKEFVARVERDGGRVLDLSPAQQQAFMRDEIDRWSKLVTQYGVTAD